jgi:hypothetical protein
LGEALTWGALWAFVLIGDLFITKYRALPILGKQKKRHLLEGSNGLPRHQRVRSIQLGLM